MQLARVFGASVTGVCSGANVELVRSLGASSCVDCTCEDFTASVVLYDVVLDAVGRRKSAAYLRSVGQALTPGGVCMSVDDGRPRLQVTDLEELARLASVGSFRPVIDRKYPLEQIVEAHRYVDQGHKRGNVIVNVAAPAGHRRREDVSQRVCQPRAARLRIPDMFTPGADDPMKGVVRTLLKAAVASRASIARLRSRRFHLPVGATVGWRPTGRNRALIGGLQLRTRSSTFGQPADDAAVLRRAHVRRLFNRLNGWIVLRVWNFRYRRWRNRPP